MAHDSKEVKQLLNLLCYLYLEGPRFPLFRLRVSVIGCNTLCLCVLSADTPVAGCRSICRLDGIPQIRRNQFFCQTALAVLSDGSNRIIGAVRFSHRLLRALSRASLYIVKGYTNSYRAYDTYTHSTDRHPSVGVSVGIFQYDNVLCLITDTRNLKRENLLLCPEVALWVFLLNHNFNHAAVAHVQDVEARLHLAEAYASLVVDSHGGHLIVICQLSIVN